MTARIDFDAVRARHRLAAVARRTGYDVADSGDVMVCCPIPDHHDDTPSMMLHLDTDRYHCFGCHASGDVIQWVRDITRASVTDAVNVLDQNDSPILSKAGTNGQAHHQRPVRAAPRSEPPNLERTTYNRVRSAVEAAWAYYSWDRLHAQGAGYLADRRIDLTALEAETHGPVIGHTPGRFDGLVARLRAKGYTDDELVDASLALRRPDGHVIDFFRRRAILPVKDDHQRVIGLIGRYSADDRDRARAPKYLNMRTTLTYNKQTAIYRPTQTALGRHASVVVCEGTLDALAIAAQAATSHLSHLYAPITTSGLSLSPTQVADVLAIHPHPPVIAGDGDPAGQQHGSLRWATAFLAAGRQSVIVPWPDGEDPASWLARHGEDGLLAVTRKGCCDSPANEVRPRHVGEFVTKAEVASLPQIWDGTRTKGLLEVVDHLPRYTAKLSPAGAERYARAAAPVLAPVVVDLALTTSVDTYGHIDQVIEAVAAWGARLPEAGRETFAYHAATAMECRDLGSAGWLERTVHAAIHLRTYEREGRGATVDRTRDYVLKPAI